MSKKVWDPAPLLAPLPPVLVTCGSEENPNILTVAWTGITCSKPPCTYISLREERFSYSLIKESGEFTINLTTSDLTRAVDFCGVKSGKNTDKRKEMNLHTCPGVKVSCPSLEESPLSLECKVIKVLPLGSHTMFLAEIKSVLADEKYISPDGRLMMEKMNLLSYAHGSYFSLARNTGKFGYSVRKKPHKKNR